MNIQNAHKSLSAYIAADIPVFLWGAPGVGKSDLVALVANEAGLPLIDVRAALLESVDFRGLPHVENGRAKWAIPDFLPDAGRDGADGILFLDELNAAPASVQVACFQLVLNRAIGEYKLPAGWRIIAAGNRQSDRAAAQKMPSALANRFAHLDVDADADAWRVWANGAGNIAPVISAFIAFRPALLHKMDGADLRAFPTPRAWAQVSKIAGAPDDIRPALVRGLVGDAAAGEFEGFIRVWSRLPSIDSILANPSGAMVPDMSEPALMFALCGALARKATRANFAAVLEYVDRLPRDFSVLATIDAVRRDRTLIETRAYCQWAAANADVTI